MDVTGHLAFLKARADDIQRIADQSGGTVEVEELQSEAWIAAEILAIEHGIEIDWRDSTNQDQILEDLKTKYVANERRKRRGTISADQARVDQDGSTTCFIDFLSAEETADPLVLLERREEEAQEKARREQEDAFLESFSQSVAYNAALWHFDNIIRRLAAHLAIDRNTLSDRISRAAMALKMQSSLFDRIERIPDDFMPMGREACVPVIQDAREGCQWAWQF